MPPCRLGPGRELGRSLWKREWEEVMRRWLVTALTVTMFLVAQPAQAVDEGFNVNLFKPTLNPHGYFSVDGARSLKPLQFHGNMLLNYAHNPLQIQGASQDLIEDLALVHVVFGLGLLEMGNGGLEVGLDIPIVAENRGDQFLSTTEKLEEPIFGDWRLGVKLTVFDRRDDAIGLFVRAWYEFPTSDQEEFLSNEDARGTTALFAGVEKQLGEAVRLGGEIGYEYIDGDIDVGGLSVDDKFHANAGLAFIVFEGETSSFEIMGEIKTYGRVSHIYEHTRENPVDFNVGLKYAGDFHLTAAVGGGLNSGVGAPDGRLVLGAGFTF